MAWVRHSRGSLVSALVAITLVATISNRDTATAQESASEYQIKSAYLYNFAKMTQWPARALPPNSDLVIGVIGGAEDFVTVLRTTLSGKSVNGHNLEVRRLRSSAELPFCNMVFFRGSDIRLPDAIASLKRSDVLLVGEDRNFLDQGGMLTLIPENGKITYQVNAAALHRSDLHFGTADFQNAGAASSSQGEGARAILVKIDPDYPRLAASMQLAGAVQLEATVRPDGTVKKVRVLGGHPVLAQAATEALMRWRYEPGSKETTEVVRISFAPK